MAKNHFQIGPAKKNLEIEKEVYVVKMFFCENKLSRIRVSIFFAESTFANLKNNELCLSQIEKSVFL